MAAADALAALAEAAARNGYVRPEVDDGFALEIEAGRHPVVERMMPREAFIPNDVRLDAEHQIMIVTGPNMAGKSTVLRQVGLARAAGADRLASCRRARARIGVVDRLFTRVGASDNLARGQTTFMVEMSETAAILHNATRGAWSCSTRSAAAPRPTTAWPSPGRWPSTCTSGSAARRSSRRTTTS